MPACSSTQITIPNITSGWRAGQYVYIRCPTLRKLGGMSWTENHPFSIASAEGGQLVLVVRKRGNWTRALYDLAVQGQGSQEAEKGKGDKTAKCKVIIEGPFVSVPSCHPALVLMTGRTRPCAHPVLLRRDLGSRRQWYRKPCDHYDSRAETRLTRRESSKTRSTKQTRGLRATPRSP